MIDLSERPMYPEIGNCDLFSDARRKTCYERGKISITYSKRSKLTVKDIRVSLPFPYGDGAKTQGHALYNRPLDAHARRRKKDLEPPRRRANIYSEISGLFHRRKCCVVYGDASASDICRLSIADSSACA